MDWLGLLHGHVSVDFSRGILGAVFWVWILGADFFRGFWGADFSRIL